MMIFALTFEDDVRDWYVSLPQGSIANFDQFEDACKKRWASDLDGGMALDKFLQMAKTDKENVKEYIQRFGNLLREIPNRFKPSDVIILERFIKGARGHLTYDHRDKKPKNLTEAKETLIEIEQNMNAVCVEMFNYPKVKIETKSKPKSQLEEVVLALAQKVDKLSNDVTIGQKSIMNRLTTLERDKGLKSNYPSKD